MNADDRAPVSDEGGDPACWLELVCDDCGALVTEGEQHECAAQRPSAE